MNFELMIYHENSKQTYLYFIRENLKLIKVLEQQKNDDDSWSLLDNEYPYVARAKHLQLMSIIGITAEHLIKLILLKRGYILNEAEANKYSDKFMDELKEYNKNTPSQESFNKLYSRAEKEAKIIFSNKLKKFDICLNLFRKANEKDYFSAVKPLRFEGYKYLDEFNELNGTNCLKVIQKMRNSYIHKAEGRAEMNGIILYMHNFIMWLAKKEYPVFFKEEKYIENDDDEKLFENDS